MFSFFEIIVHEIYSTISSFSPMFKGKKKLHDKLTT